ncbi:MAG TPA: DUF6062 family protein, partial [Chloroflexia bacterium]|nr:DUF6062 family protein [Chloroflexia bacterium]
MNTPDGMGDAALDRTAYELLGLFEQPGCPVCAFTAQAVLRYLETISYEAVTDPDVRLELRESLGYCGIHAQQWLDRGNALGTALIYKDLCDRLGRVLDSAASSPPAGTAGGKLRQLLGGGGGAG